MQNIKSLINIIGCQPGTYSHPLFHLPAFPKEAGKANHSLSWPHLQPGVATLPSAGLQDVKLPGTALAFLIHRICGDKISLYLHCPCLE